MNFPELNPNQQRLWLTLQFLLRLLILSIPLYLILWFGNLIWLQMAVANQINFLLQTLGFGISQTGNPKILLSVAHLDDPILVKVDKPAKANP